MLLLTGSKIQHYYGLVGKAMELERVSVNLSFHYF